MLCSVYLSNVWRHGTVQHFQFTNSTNITINGMSQVYNGTNATDIPLNIRRSDDVNVTACDQNNESSCHIATPGEYLLVHLCVDFINFSMQPLDI